MISESGILILSVVGAVASALALIATIGSVASMNVRVTFPLLGSAEVSFGGERRSQEAVQKLEKIDYAELSDQSLFELLSDLNVADIPKSLIDELGRRDANLSLGR